MASAHPNPSVLSRLYLGAVLPCLTDLAEHDERARDILGTSQGAIEFRVLQGPSATLRLAGGRVACEEGRGRYPSVILLFFGDDHLNAFFSGKKWAVPLPVWGGWRVNLLARFSKLAHRLEAVLDGAPDVIDSAAGRRLHARLSLVVAGLALRPLAEGDAAAREVLRALPPGLASFTIGGEAHATIWFEHGSNRVGWSEPPRLPDVRIVFEDARTAYAALREEIDTMAAVGSGKIRVDGLVPLADGLNVVMERLRAYLKP